MSLATTLGQSRFHGSDQPTEEIRLTRRTLRPMPPGWSGWSPRTQLALAGLGLLTAVLGTVLAVQVVSAQDLRADGRAAGAALTAALEAALLASAPDDGALEPAAEAVLRAIRDVGRTPVLGHGEPVGEVVAPLGRTDQDVTVGGRR